MPQALERDLGNDGDRGGVDELGDLGAGDRGADDHAAVGVDDQPRRPGGVAAVEGAAGVARGRDVDDLDVEALLGGDLRGDPDGGDLRVGEDDARAGGPVGAVLGRGALAEHVVGGDAGLVLAHVRQQRAAVYVADGVEPLVLGGAAVLVDLDGLARLEAEVLEALRARLAADRDQQLLAAGGLAVVGLDDRHARLAVHPDRLAARADVDAELAQGLGHLLAGEGLLARDEPALALDQRHARPQGRPRLRKLGPRHSAAQYDEALGHLLGGGRLAVGPRLRIGQAVDRRDQRLGAGRDDDRPARLERTDRRRPRPCAHPSPGRSRARRARCAPLASRASRSRRDRE